MRRSRKIIVFTLSLSAAIAVFFVSTVRPTFPKGVTLTFEGLTNDAWNNPVGVFVVSNNCSSAIFIADHSYGGRRFQSPLAGVTIRPPIREPALSKWQVLSGGQCEIRYYAPPNNEPWNFAVEVTRYGVGEKLAVVAMKTRLAKWVPAKYRSLPLIKLETETIPAKIEK